VKNVTTYVGTHAYKKAFIAMPVGGKQHRPHLLISPRYGLFTTVMMFLQKR
jgi:hypothetical protein